MYTERLSGRERLILNILYAAKRPMTARDIIQENKGLSQSTVQTTFRRLLERGLVKVAGITHSGNVLVRQYVVAEAAEKEVLLYIMEEYQQIRDIISVSEYIMLLIQEENDESKQKQLIQDLNDLIQKIESENNINEWV